jgi:hypothetical protein
MAGSMLHARAQRMSDESFPDSTTGGCGGVQSGHANLISVPGL